MLTQPVTGSFDLVDDGVVQQAVEERRGDNRVRGGSPGDDVLTQQGECASRLLLGDRFGVQPFRLEKALLVGFVIALPLACH
jgi:hypothetical protein